MNNSIFLKVVKKITNFLVNMFENSNLYSIFSKKSKPTKSTIIRKTIDDNITKYSKAYKIVCNLFQSKRKKHNNSKFLHALEKPFLSGKLSLLFMIIITVFLKYILQLNKPLSIIIPLFIALFLIQFTQYLLGKSVYQNSKLFRFVKYIYDLEV